MSTAIIVEIRRLISRKASAFNNSSYSNLFIFCQMSVNRLTKTIFQKATWVGFFCLFGKCRSIFYQFLWGIKDPWDFPKLISCPHMCDGRENDWYYIANTVKFTQTSLTLTVCNFVYLRIRRQPSLSTTMIYFFLIIIINPESRLVWKSNDEFQNKI